MPFASFPRHRFFSRAAGILGAGAHWPPFRASGYRSTGGLVSRRPESDAKRLSNGESDVMTIHELQPRSPIAHYLGRLRRCAPRIPDRTPNCTDMHCERHPVDLPSGTHRTGKGPHSCHKCRRGQQNTVAELNSSRLRRIRRENHAVRCAGGQKSHSATESSLDPADTRDCPTPGVPWAYLDSKARSFGARREIRRTQCWRLGYASFRRCWHQPSRSYAVRG